MAFNPFPMANFDSASYDAAQQLTNLKVIVLIFSPHIQATNFDRSRTQGIRVKNGKGGEETFKIHAETFGHDKK
jgi:hypothetical protein